MSQRNHPDTGYTVLKPDLRNSFRDGKKDRKRHYHLEGSDQGLSQKFKRLNWLELNFTLSCSSFTLQNIFCIDLFLQQ